MAQAEMARRESERLLAELQEAHRQLQAYAAQVEVLAVAEERNRLAREVYDTLGHRLAALFSRRHRQELCDHHPAESRRPRPHASRPHGPEIEVAVTLH